MIPAKGRNGRQGDKVFCDVQALIEFEITKTGQTVNSIGAATAKLFAQVEFRAPEATRGFDADAARGKVRAGRYFGKLLAVVLLEERSSQERKGIGIGAELSRSRVQEEIAAFDAGLLARIAPIPDSKSPTGVPFVIDLLI